KPLERRRRRRAHRRRCACHARDRPEGDAAAWFGRARHPSEPAPIQSEGASTAAAAPDPGARSAGDLPSTPTEPFPLRPAARTTTTSPTRCGLVRQLPRPTATPSTWTATRVTPPTTPSVTCSARDPPFAPRRFAVERSERIVACVSRRTRARAGAHRRWHLHRRDADGCTDGRLGGGVRAGEVDTVIVP